MALFNRSAVRSLHALGALLLLCSCATTGTSQPDTKSVFRDDPYLLDPTSSYPLTGAADLAPRVEEAFGALLAGGDPADTAAVGMRVLAEDAGFHPATVLLAQVEYLRQEDPAAMELLLPVLGELPGYTAAQLLLGRAAERSGAIPVGFKAFARISAVSDLAARRAEELRPQAIEIVSNRLHDELSRGRLEDAETWLAWLVEWAGNSREAFEGTRYVAVERGDPETELTAVRHLADQTGELEYRQREAELEVQIGDLRSGLEKLEVLNREFPDDPLLAESLDQAAYLWRLQLLPPEVQDIGRKVEIDRADVATLLYWLIPRVRHSRISNPPIAADILDHPQRDSILRVLSLRLMEVDETLHRFEPATSATRVVVFRALTVLLGTSPRRLSCMAEAESLEIDRSWSSLCSYAARCQLIAESADCRPTASVSGADALELFRRTLNLLGSS